MAFYALSAFEAERKEADRQKQEPRLIGYLAERLFGIFTYIRETGDAVCGTSLSEILSYRTGKGGKHIQYTGIQAKTDKDQNKNRHAQIKPLISGRKFKTGSAARTFLR